MVVGMGAVCGFRPVTVAGPETALYERAAGETTGWVQAWPDLDTRPRCHPAQTRSGGRDARRIGGLGGGVVRVGAVAGGGVRGGLRQREWHGSVCRRDTPRRPGDARRVPRCVSRARNSPG